MKCMSCGRSLKNKKSVLNNIGPICQKKMRDYHIKEMGLSEDESIMAEEIIDALNPLGLIYLKKINFKHEPDHRYKALINCILEKEKGINKRIEPLVRALRAAYLYKQSGKEEFYKEAVHQQNIFHKKELAFSKNNFGLVETLEGVNFVDSLLKTKSAKAS